jgi:hypothetical protein
MTAPSPQASLGVGLRSCRLATGWGPCLRLETAPLNDAIGLTPVPHWIGEESAGFAELEVTRS